ncbi:hypothetical protein KI387_010732 [Taxus chinensis]|uniref:Protein kinase domain-containing protein n=1 Tax=Taxus chinensis TaxID=29808 RepID=A0AA38FN81_TAXCH|nr:hypothetical protein KI387_010732 [Taxus chinensis]
MLTSSWLASHCDGACHVFKCGNYTLDYPFGLNNSGCGDPLLQLECDYTVEGALPLLNIGGHQYYILQPKQYSKVNFWEGFYSHTMRILDKHVLEDQCDLSPNIYDQFLGGAHFRIADGYKNITLGKTCFTGSSEAVNNTNCKGRGYYDFRVPNTGITCDSKFELPVNEIDLAKPLDQIVSEGLEIRWTASKHCDNCESDYRNCSHRKTPSFCYCGGISYAQNCVSGKSKKFVIILGSTIGGVALAAILALFLIFRVKRRKSLVTWVLPCDFSKETVNDMEASRPGCMISNLPIFSYEELQEATNFFDEENELGDGGFGAVYLGKLRDGRTVAVKKLYQQNSRRIEQFLNEVQIFATMDHPKLVRLYGCTHPESPVLLLVYEFLPNGTLADHLHGNRRRPKGLPWGTRLNIAIETAQALAYLHSINPPIIHRDVKSTNILLDENFRAKVADFGLSRLVPVNASHVTTAPQGTPGYVDPEYHQWFQLTEKSDVYSFGVVLAELLSAKLAVDITRKSNEISLAIMTVNRIKTGALDELVDPHLGIQTNPEVKAMVSAVAELALGCLASDSDVRPDMKEVAAKLEEIKQLHKTYFDEQSELSIKESASVLVGSTCPG